MKEPKTNLKMNIYRIAKNYNRNKLPPQLRGISPNCFIYLDHLEPPLEEINSYEKIAEMINSLFGAGEYNIRTFCRGKTTTRVKMVTLCNCTIRKSHEEDDKFSYTFDKTGRLSHYRWFFRDFRTKKQQQQDLESRKKYDR